MNISFKPLLELQGLLAAVVVDSDTGRVVASAERNAIDVERAAVANSQVVQAVRRARRILQMDDALDEIIVSTDREYQLIRLLDPGGPHFFLLSLDKNTTTLALAQITLSRLRDSVLRRERAMT